MYVNGLHLSTRIDKSCTEIEANLHSISVCDLNDDTTYNKVGASFHAQVDKQTDPARLSTPRCGETDCKNRLCAVAGSW